MMWAAVLTQSIESLVSFREERNAITINTNDVSGRSTPSAVSYDGKLRHVGAPWRESGLEVFNPMADPSCICQ